MAELQHKSNEHLLVFNEDTSSPSDTTYNCFACAANSCRECGFYLHKKCAEAPSPPRFITLICYKKVNIEHGSYYCSRPGCDFVIQVQCSIEKWSLYVPHAFTYQTDEPHYLFYDQSHQVKCNACGEYFGDQSAHHCKDCTLVFHTRCVALPHIAWHKCDEHSLTLAYQDRNHYPLHYYCDICEEERDPQQWFYHCETCDNAMHIKYVLGKYSFITVGSKYKYEDHKHTLTFVKKIYYYPECDRCHEPCQGLSLECQEHGCEYIVHWRCIKPYDADSE
ncbi:hypothetical protein GQ457_03G028080 [Hibiscus cannabinus]